jgi:hypothetical protein
VLSTAAKQGMTSGEIAVKGRFLAKSNPGWICWEDEDLKQDICIQF